MSDISTAELHKEYLAVNGRQMAYAETGEGASIVFLHGNPTSSYLWRNIIPLVDDGYRAIAPDLIGMGDSDKLEGSGPDRYRFIEHFEYLDTFLAQKLGDEKVILVIHDWGSALGFHWANLNPEKVRGICFMEGIVAPIKSWDDWNQQSRPIFQAMRSPSGEEIVLEKNIFIEKILPGSILRDLSEEEMNAYRKPFLKAGEDRRPTLTWPRQIPIEGEPEDVTSIVKDYADWLSKIDIPKLFINAEPGAIIHEKQRAIIRQWPNLSEATVRGSHFIQEDSPREIGLALREWADKLP